MGHSAERGIHGLRRTRAGIQYHHLVRPLPQLISSQILTAFHRYRNVLAFLPRNAPLSTRFAPFLRLLPFPLSCALHIAWLAAPAPPSLLPHTSPAPPPLPAGLAPLSPAQAPAYVLHSALFVPFLCAWGAQFAHQVGRMILAHVTKRAEMPAWEGLWVLTALGALDAWLPVLTGR